VVDLRETFAARGHVSAQGSFREWTNGNLQALLEPTTTGQRLRIRTVKGSAQSLILAGMAMAGAAVVMALVTVIPRGGSLGDALLGIAPLMTMAAGLLGVGALQLPSWARLRGRQMDDVLARLPAANVAWTAAAVSTVTLPTLMHPGLVSTLSSPEFLALQQALVGRYSVTRELGRGGMGIVYLAQEVRLDRPVALKVLPPTLAARPELRERFLREARTAARLSHPHIVPIHAVHEIGPFVFFAMSYIEGETLGERIRAKGTLTHRDAVRILREIGWALAHAHAHGVVHRDVKPDNILLEAGSGRAVVTDFGIAHSSAAGPADVGEVIGTAEFMSPEQARGERVDERSDLYALGVVGYYMLSGRLPFQDATPAATLTLRLTQDAPRLASVVPGLPAPLARVVDRCLARDLAQRVANGEELTAALDQAAEGRREVPGALRLFMKQNREATVPMVATEVFSAGSLTVWGTLFALGIMDGLPLLLAPATVWLVLGSTPVVMLVQMARQLLRSGYGHADLVRALRDDLEERRGDLDSAYGSGPSRLDRWLKRLLAGGLGVHLAGLGWLAFGPWLPGSGEVLATVLAASCATWVGAGSVTAVRHQLRGHLPGQGWLEFWKSRLGRAVFKMSRLQLEETQAGAPYGPTELAIGMAADRLFEALPQASGRPSTSCRTGAVQEPMPAHALTSRNWTLVGERETADSHGRPGDRGCGGQTACPFAAG
jgi:serine/threonine-protein kinase